jgi:hypothetical protein
MGAVVGVAAELAIAEVRASIGIEPHTASTAGSQVQTAAKINAPPDMHKITAAQRGIG